MTGTLHSSSMYALAKLLEELPVSIEILPGDPHEWIMDDSPNQAQISPYLFVERHLGIPKKVLYQLYMTAIIVFQAAKKGALTMGGTSRSTDSSNLIASSSVILLANPAHQTALNARKRLIQEGLLDPHRELDFITALQSARECAKECILWDHRRWLFRRLYIKMDDMGGQSNDHSSSPPLHIPPAVIQKEFELVSKACEIYPRNYYAWNHWKFCMDTLCFSLQVNAGHMDILVLEFLHLQRWVECHVSDHSSVHHLCNLTRRLHNHPTQYLSPIDPASVYEHALSLVTSYPTHETLWLYLRAARYFSDNKRPERTSRMFSSALTGQFAHRCLAWWALRDGRLCLEDYSAHRVIAGDCLSSEHIPEAGTAVTNLAPTG